MPELYIKEINTKCLVSLNLTVVYNHIWHRRIKSTNSYRSLKMAQHNKYTYALLRN